MDNVQPVPILVGALWLLRSYEVILKPPDSNFKEKDHHSDVLEYREEWYHFGPHWNFLVS